MTYHCVGCGQPRIWNGETHVGFCDCRATFFVEDNSPISAVFIARMNLSNYPYGEVPHIDFYVGISDYISKEKDEVVSYLDYQKGSIWSWKCINCGVHTVDYGIKMMRHQVPRRHDFNLHPELRKLMPL